MLLRTTATAWLGEVISQPSIITANQKEAVISQGTEIPYQEASSSGASTITFKPALLELKVTPLITPDNRLILDISVKKDRVGQVVVTAGGVNVPAIDTSQLTTTVFIGDGQTVVLGGILETERRDTVNKVPFLGDIPGLGWLFRSYSNQKTKTNLYFFLTPNILDETDFSDMSEVSFRKKMEAAKYIGHRRMQMVDRKWREPTMAQRLEDSGATVDDLDQYGGFEIPSYKRGADAATKQPPLPPRERDAILGPKR